MGGFLISTLGTLSNRAYYLFLIIVAVWFFGVYVPLNERKKRQDGQAAAGKGPQREEKPPRRLSRPAAPRQPEPRAPAREPVDGARLDQLEALLDAGVLTPEEYRERRSKVLEGKR